VTIGISNHDGVGGQLKITVGPDGVGYTVGYGVGAGTPEVSLTLNDQLPKDAAGVDAKASVSDGFAGASIGGKLSCTSGGSCTATATGGANLGPVSVSDELKGTCNASGCTAQPPDVSAGVKAGPVTVSPSLTGDKVDVKAEPPESEAPSTTSVGATGYIDVTSSRGWTWSDIGNGIRSALGFSPTPAPAAPPPQPDPAPSPTPTPSPTPQSVPVTNPDPAPLGPSTGFFPMPGGGLGIPVLPGAATLD
jgi:hypothetical protein